MPLAWQKDAMRTTQLQANLIYLFTAKISLNKLYIKQKIINTILIVIGAHFNKDR